MTAEAQLYYWEKSPMPNLVYKEWNYSYCHIISVKY